MSGRIKSSGDVKRGIVCKRFPLFFAARNPPLKKEGYMTVYGYIRVSTDRQTTENQRFKIEKHIAGQGFGRPSGSKNGAHVWDEREEKIRHLLNRGAGKKRIAKIVGISAESIRRFAREVKPAPIVPIDSVASIAPALFA